ncbi:uncharacterized protein LOC141660983 [Apium graveolens]|uniref:uncharacterized protein LOC141660983 n=1 Tax=Apium graveolens TaxID=4045 RepID=UPI003D7B0025
MLNFQVVKAASTYNAIMGRTGIHAFKAVPLTYHMVLPIEDIDVCENEKLRGKPAEDLVPIPLDFLDRRRSSDMPEIDPNLITHKLNIDPTRKVMKQKKRTYAPNRLEAIKQEVEKLLEAGFIVEVQFFEWLATPVMVKKANGKWRMCIDFIDLNDACPKDCYPLPRIDTMIDATVGHEMLNFMNGFSSYNQIKMHRDDTLKISFITNFDTMEVYVDDMLVKSLSKADHISHLGEAFEVLRHHKMMLNPIKCAFRAGSGKFLGHMVSKRGIEAKPDKIKAILDMEPTCSIKDIQKLTGRIAARGSSKASGRLIKWEIELGEFDIKYKPRTAIKAQALVDFVVECTINDQKIEGARDSLVLQSLNGFIIEYALKLDFPTTNNEVEYEALIGGLGLARAVRAKKLKVCEYSRLVVAQVNGVFEAKDDTMAKYLRIVKGILTQFDEWLAKHIPREENTAADAISQFASSEIENYPRSIYFQVLKTPTIYVINLIAPVGVASCWIDLIKIHLETRWIPNDAQEARKLSVRALRYSLIEGLLYKKSIIIPYLKCLRPLEAEEALKEAHEGIYGQHLGGWALANKITRLGFYWPTMLADVKNYVKKYDREYCDDNSKELRFTSIVHPQANGKAEVANRIILDELKKRVERSKNTWPDELLPILWAYRTTFKVTTKATTFMLAYRSEVLVPIKNTHGSPRIEAYEPETNEEGMRLTFDLIDEVRDEANARNIEHQ